MSETQHHLTRSEAEALTRSGLFIVSIWESPRLVEGRELLRPKASNYFAKSFGFQDGADAIAYARQIGQPSGTPIYFAVDFDAQDSDALNIERYFSDIEACFRAENALESAKHNVGVYGSGFVLQICRTAGLASYFWQCMSTGYKGNRDPIAFANIRQELGGMFCGLDVDFDESDGAEGSWILPIT